MIFLVITADCGIAMATFLVRVPLLLTTRLTASETSSNFSIWPSVIQPFSKGSDAKRSTMNSPEALCPNSTSFTLDVLISSPIIDECVRPNSASRKLTTVPPKCDTECVSAARWIVKKLLEC